MDRQPLVGRVVGGLFLAAFACYGAGSALVSSAPALGALLVLGNSLVVAAIGALMFGVLHRSSPAAAAGYLVARGAEATLLVATATGPDEPAYSAAMLALGIGSIPFCLALRRQRLVPARLALAGVAGYAVLATGAALEIAGLRVGSLLAVPGGLFELALALTLLVRGLPVRTAAAELQDVR
jgi:hypothetical protein